MIWIMLWNVYQLHDLLSSIVSNRDSQFISTMWKSLCKWLRITASLFTVYHFEINDQSKWVNQDIECKLRIYCNYMQDDWVKWISMIKFSNNSNIFSITSMISFYFNKKFHFQMSFNSDTTDYETTCEHLEVRKVNDIIIWMKELLNFNHQQLKKTKLIIKVQIRSVVEFKLLNLTQIELQCWVELRRVNLTRSSWVQLSTQLNQLDELTWTQWHV